MNCDQAFDYLTDPQQRESSDLARHLADCRRCRTMRDALEPALDLFDELAPEPDLSAVAHSRRTVLSADSLQLAEQTAARLAGPTRTIRRRIASWRAGVGYAAAALFGAGIALAVHATVDGPAASIPVNESRCLWQEHDSVAPLKPESKLLTAQCMNCHFTAWFAPADGPRTPMSSRDFLKVRTAVVLRAINPAPSEVYLELGSDMLICATGHTLPALAVSTADSWMRVDHATT
jgi:hypothetical protein